jgi:phosphoribosylglycinamide formyltransferase-1
MSRKVRAAIFISGRGSNMMALVEAAKAADFPAEFVLVVSNDPEAGGLAWAAERGLKTVAVDHKPFGKDREAHERLINDALVAEGVEFICLAGYLRVLTPFLVDTWAGRMINIHPALLPEFKGLHTHERAIEAGATEHGATVHWVSSGVDEGEIIAQARVPVFAGDTAEVLAARVLAEEHKLYPAAVRQLLGKA